jgi:hypothetical protein
MPERQNFDGLRRVAVVKVVMDAAEVDAPDAREFCIARKRTNAWLVANEHKGALDLVSDGSASCSPIEFPPIRGFVDFRGGAASDADRKHLSQARLRSPETRVSPATTSPRCASSIA